MPRRPKSLCRVEPTGYIPGPPYTIDVVGIALPDQTFRRPAFHVIEAYHILSERIADPEFHLEYVCRGCETWVATRLERPRRKGAVSSTDSCFGCIYSHLDGHKTDFASTDRDAAFSSWADARSAVARLERERTLAKSEKAKVSLTGQLEKAHRRVASAARRCQRLGFAPGVPVQGKMARRVNADETTHDPAESSLPTCKTCTNWTQDEVLTGKNKELKGYCWVKDGESTKESQGCQHYRPDKVPRRTPDEEL